MFYYKPFNARKEGSLNISLAGRGDVKRTFQLRHIVLYDFNKT
jgi:hypothetical protein